MGTMMLGNVATNPDRQPEVEERALPNPQQRKRKNADR